MVRIPDSARHVNSPQFIIPARFEAKDVLPYSLRRQRDDARWLVHTITWKMAYDCTDVLGYVRLHSAILRRVMSRRHYAEVIGHLLNGQVLDPLAPYCPGERSFGYRLAERYLADDYKVVEAKDRGLIERLRREKQRMEEEQQEHWLPIHHMLHQHQHRLTIRPAVDAALAALAPVTRLCQSVLVGNIRRRDFRFTVGNTGRCFNAITGLKRDLRFHLRLAGEPIGGVDIRCAQPSLLVVLGQIKER
jgi:hypothetical protein